MTVEAGAAWQPTQGGLAGFAETGDWRPTQPPPRMSRRHSSLDRRGSRTWIMKVFLSLLLLTALLSFHLAGAEAAEDGTGAYSNMAAYNFIF